MPLLVDIKKTIGSFKLSVAFEADEGNILALLGASGSGKSMTLKCIAGIERPDEGVISLNGRVLFDSKSGKNVPVRERRIGYLFQEHALFPNMTVLQNIASGMGKEGTKHERLTAAARMAAGMKLSGLENRYPAQLSGGQRQRTALARALATEPELMLLDEPFSSLDDHIKWQVEDELLQGLEGYPGSVLFVSHDRNEVLRLSQWAAVIDGGHLGDVRPTAELFRQPRTVAEALICHIRNILPNGDGSGRFTAIRNEDVVCSLRQEAGSMAVTLDNIQNDENGLLLTLSNGDGQRLYAVLTDEEARSLSICKGQSLYVTLPEQKLIRLS